MLIYGYGKKRKKDKVRSDFILFFIKFAVMIYKVIKWKRVQ